MSVGELAATVGVRPRRIEALEAGRRDPDYVLLVRLARALGVSAGELLARAQGRGCERGAPPAADG